MPDPTAITDDHRREVFAAQDDGMPVARSRAEVAARFGITPEAVAAIEREGMDNQWPPL